jgi:hypothetical protein
MLSFCDDLPLPANIIWPYRKPHVNSELKSAVFRDETSCSSQSPDVSEELSLSSSGFQEKAKQGSSKIRQQTKSPEECGQISTCFSWFHVWITIRTRYCSENLGCLRITSCRKPEDYTVYIRRNQNLGHNRILSPSERIQMPLMHPNRPTECVLAF